MSQADYIGCDDCPACGHLMLTKETQGLLSPKAELSVCLDCGYWYHDEASFPAPKHDYRGGKLLGPGQ